MGRDHAQRTAPHLPPDVSPYDLDALGREDVLAYYRGAMHGVLRARGVPRKQWSDVEQEVLTRALSSRTAYDPSLGTVRRWICGIAHNTVADSFRSLRRKPDSRPGREDETAVLEQVPAPGLNPEQAVHALEWLDRLGSAVPEPLSEIFRLHAERHTREEIGDRFDLSLEAVKRRLRRLTERIDASVAEAKEERQDAARVRIGLLPPLFLVQGFRTENGAEDPCSSPGQPPSKPVTTGRRSSSDTPRKGAASRGLALVASAALLAGPLGHPLRSPQVGPLQDTGSAVAAVRDFPVVTDRKNIAALGAAMADDPGPTTPGAPSSPPPVDEARPAHLPPKIASQAARRADSTVPDALLLRAWEKLHGDRPAEALALARRHAEQFPGRSPAERAKLVAQASSALTFSKRAPLTF